MTADFCTFTPDASSPTDPNPLSETETVLPGTAAVFTPAGGTAVTGKVIGGFAGADSGAPPGFTFARRTSIDFVIDAANLVGHLNFVNNYNQGSGTDIGDGVLAIVGGATRLGLDGDFSGVPATGCSSSVGYNGALGTFAFAITGMTWCKLEGSTTTDLYRISGGTLNGGTYSGQVTTGVRRGGDLGLQLRTDQGLMDISATLSGSPLHANGATSPAMLQSRPENDSSVSFTVGGGSADTTGNGCDGTANGLKAGRTFDAAGVAPPHFNGPMAIDHNTVECQTDANLGVLEPTDDGGSGGTPCDPSSPGDPTATRTVLYTAEGGREFRGRILSSAFTVSPSGRSYGITVLLEENVTHSEPCQLPGGSAAIVDDPGTSFTVVRLVIPAGGANSAVTFAR